MNFGDFSVEDPRGVSAETRYPPTFPAVQAGERAQGCFSPREGIWMAHHGTHYSTFPLSVRNAMARTAIDNSSPSWFGVGGSHSLLFYYWKGHQLRGKNEKVAYSKHCYDLLNTCEQERTGQLACPKGRTTFPYTQ